MKAAFPSIKNILFDVDGILIKHLCVLLCDSDHVEYCNVPVSDHSLATGSGALADMACMHGNHKGCQGSASPWLDVLQYVQMGY